MKNIINFIIFFKVIFAPVFAQRYNDDKKLFYLYVGGTSANLNTVAKFNISEQVLLNFPNVSTSIDLENDLNFPETSELFYAKALVGGRLQLALTFFSLHRTGGAQLTRTFALGERTYTVSAPVSGYFNTDYYSASVRYSIVSTKIFTAGLSLGFRFLQLESGIRADSMGYVFDESGSLDIPVAVPGIHTSVYPIKNLLVRGSFEYFKLKLNGTTGTVLEGQFSAEYYILKNLGIGPGYSITHFTVEDLPQNDMYLKDIDYKIGGFQIFAALRF